MIIPTIDSVSALMRYLNGTYSITERAELVGENRELRLQRENFLLSLLGHPEKHIETIHIAGSKGKGTSAAYIAGLLRDQDPIGLYLSPHVFKETERWSYVDSRHLGIQCFEDSEYIKAGNSFLDCLGDYKKNVKMPGSVMPTPFEIYTAFAFHLFSKVGIRKAVIETGIGGRLDCTNIITPKVSVITHIEKEHTEVLGTEIEDITREKCGIIKEGVPVFALEQNKNVLDVIKEEATKKNAPLYIAKKTTPLSEKLFKNSIMQSTSSKEDLSLAIDVCTFLRKEERSSKTLSPINDIALPGRGQVVVDDNLVFVLDGAHTKDSIESVAKNISKIIKSTKLLTYTRQNNLSDTEEQTIRPILEKAIENANKPKTVIFSCFDDKDVEGMARVLIQHFETIYITNVVSFKKSSCIPHILLSLEKALNENPNNKVKDVFVKPTLEDCITAIKTRTDDIVPVAVLGSFYLVGEFFDTETIMAE